MAVKVIGAGLGRTGTHSLKIALETLLGGTCHHMVEVFQHPDEIRVWTAAAEGTMPDWEEFLAGYTATCDWPSAAFWPELSAAFPDALVLLSVRDAESWWKSASNTILLPILDASRKADDDDAWSRMILTILHNRFTDDLGDPDVVKARVTEWNDHVRATADQDRLLVWQASDGWGPICRELGVPVPDEPFPLTNTTAEFRQMMGAPPLDS
jgi:hypothetical protein